MTLGERLRAHREAAGKKQIDVVELFQAAGHSITKQAYSAWEHEDPDRRSSPSPENLARFCAVLGLSGEDRLELYDLLAKHDDPSSADEPTPNGQAA